MPTKQLVGLVVSDKMDKTVVVAVERRIKHDKYLKTVVRTKRYKAHDEWNRCKIGDQVRIYETRPLSRTKCWMVDGILSAREHLSQSAHQEETNEESMFYRSVEAYLPKKVHLGETFPLSISIGADATQDALWKDRKLQKVEVRAHVYASSSEFELDQRVKFIEISSEPTALTFSLKAKQPGEKSVEIEIFQNDRCLGGTKLLTEVYRS